MADERGYRVIVKLNLPQRVQYQSGDSVIVQGDSTNEVENLLQELAGGPEQAHFILLRFAEEALRSSVEQKMTAPVVQVTGGTVSDRPVAPTETVAAPAALVAFAATKLGKTVEELTGKSEDEIKALLREGL